MKKKIAILGGGGSGLCAAKHMITAEGDVELIPVVFEQKNAIGGAWVYEEVVGKEEVVSSIYKNLKTNLPKQVMLFPDFPFADEAPSFVHHTAIRDYIQSYAEHFKVTEHVRLNTKIIDVEPIVADKQDDNQIGAKWRVTSKDLKTGNINKEEFDGVAVCNGHFTKPYIPPVEGIENFKKPVLHSHSYRNPEDFDGKTILILGFGISGRDICSELTKHCAKIYISHKGNRQQPNKLPDNIIELNDISHVNADGQFVFKDETIVDADVFMYCTGYEYDLSFLNEKVNLKVEDRKAVHGLYKHIVYAEMPSLCIVGLPWVLAYFPLIHQQCAFVAALFSGKIKLPSKVEMQEDIEEYLQEFLSENKPARNLQMFRLKQFPYNDMLASISGCTKNRPVIGNIFAYMIKLMTERPLQNFKDIEFKELDDESYEVIEE